ncbi:hypothetical protein AB1Y20_018846 [Prymnesium parvum]|uniref:PDZ domain-containing protein n=1 Tax=Prymnesium parvum TaxID=97485 RepID=A0AB34JTA3_PRYPA
MAELHFQNEGGLQELEDVSSVAPRARAIEKQDSDGGDKLLTLPQDNLSTTPMRTMMRPHHRRTPSAPASLPSAEVLRTPSSTRAAAPVGMDEEIVVQLTRVDGSFGLTLNTFNRITGLKPGSAGALAGVKVFDRVIRVDGLLLEGKMSDALKGREHVELTIERPPSALFNAIAIKENSPRATSPLMLRTPGLGSMLRQVPRPSSPLKEERNRPKSPQTPDVVRAMEALAVAASSDAPLANPAKPSDPALSVAPTTREAKLTQTRGHRRNVSEPVNVADLRGLRSELSWRDPLSGWHNRSFHFNLKGGKDSSKSGKETSSSKSEVDKACDGSPRSVTSNPDDEENEPSKARHEESSGVEGRREWWRRGSKVDAEAKARAKETARLEKETKKELQRLKEPRGVPIALPVMRFEVDADEDEQGVIEVC